MDNHAASLLLCRRFAIVLTFGFIMSGFFLLVSHISQMDPQITHIMPVLQSPLLSIHVSVIMTLSPCSRSPSSAA